MNPNEQAASSQQGPSLPLPGIDPKNQQDSQTNPAADLIRQKVASIYAQEPDFATEALDEAEVGPSSKKSRHQQYIYDLTNSGKSLAEIQQQWREYYAGLPDQEKHEVWQEFYSSHAQASQYTAAMPSAAPKELQYEVTPVTQPAIANAPPKPAKAVSKTLADLRDYALGSVGTRKKLKPMQHLQSLLFGIGVGTIVVLIFLFSFFNERFIAPFIQPSRNVNNTPIISSSTPTGSDPKIIIPKINVEIPVVYDISTIAEAAVDKGLERGVVHYATTSNPGQNGNTVIVGHSSNNIFNKGKYKFAFVLLSRLENGDTFYLQRDGKRYTYEVYQKKIVKPTDVSVLNPVQKPAVATLITCDPPGTSTNRLVVTGEQISPDPSTNSAQLASVNQPTQPALIPGNAPSLWSRLTHWLSL